MPINSKNRIAAKKKTDVRTSPKKKTVMFVCTGNTCRSAMAEYIFKDALKRKNLQDLYNVCSCGVSATIGDDMPIEAKNALNFFSVGFKKHKSKQATVNLVNKAHLIIAMTVRHKDFINCPEKCKTMGELCGGSDVPDPYGGSDEVYKKTAEYIMYAAEDIIKYLLNNN